MSSTFDLGTNIAFLLQGAIITVKLWSFTVLLCLPLSTIVAIIRFQKIFLISKLFSLFTSLIRGTPLLLQLYFIYFALPILLNIKLDGFIACLIAFTLSWTAYINEVIRLGLESIEKWQFDSAKSLGFTYMQALWYIILPQAFWKSLAGISNELVQLLYNTPIVGILGLEELLKNAKVIVVRTFDFTPFLLLGAFYLVCNGLIMLVINRIERKLSRFKLSAN